MNTVRRYAADVLPGDKILTLAECGYGTSQWVVVQSVHFITSRTAPTQMTGVNLHLTTAPNTIEVLMLDANARVLVQPRN